MVAGADPHRVRAGEDREPEPIPAAGRRLEAMHQRDRFGRDLLARELESAAATIEDLEKRLEETRNETD